ncbi:MAG TPA: Zn-ribbon domain-containing OB-fold protein [Syntrophales bacterium]|nr:Zn-ribbon domain-containing OB-fold protein [Syntrophales bacterium]HOL59151.1 Zn-ribbon domain-containing OB-fold protein [Syntrophales bacterium]HPO36096.1 Zn-ribbon domain-containing OB-fold protein [Syntrophales bacterium]
MDDRFKRFGTISFTATTKTNDFISHLEAGEVTGTRCRVCGKVYFPPRADCFACLSSDMEWFPVSGKGRLVTYSTLRYAPVGFEKDVPYTIAVVDFGHFKVFGRLAKEIPEEKVSVGMELKVKVNELPNGQLNYVFSIPD